MKNNEIIMIVASGFLQATSNTLPVADAYKVGKFRRLLEKAYGEIQEQQKKLLESVGLEDYIKALGEYHKSKDEALKEKLEKADALIEEMGKDDTPLEGVKAISFESWHLLRAENSKKEINGKEVDLIPNKTEDILEGIFWNEPEE